MSDPGQHVLILGACSHGPFRHAEANLLNPDVHWTSCGYGTSHIDGRILEKIQSGTIPPGTPVVLATWDMDRDSRATPLRFGKIDYIGNYGNYVVFTVFLDEVADKAKRLPLGDNPRLLCRYGELIDAGRHGKGVLSRS